MWCRSLRRLVLSSCGGHRGANCCSFRVIAPEFTGKSLEISIGSFGVKQNEYLDHVDCQALARSPSLMHG
ncbi:MAG: hypothetical protein RI897_3055 [Verrucomicrobiota bacterium]|jgi:hypothetical protein